jgi:hypothetical protein
MKLQFKRFPFFVLLLMALFFILVLPSLLPIQNQTQKQATMNQNNVQSQHATATSIFNNNLLVAGITFIPIVGWGYLIFAMWNTGVVIASYGQPWYWIFNNPFAWVELAIYSYVVLQSWKLLGVLKQHKIRDWFHPGGYYKLTFVKTIAYTFITITLTLLLSAILEYAVIASAVRI